MNVDAAIDERMPDADIKSPERVFARDSQTVGPDA